MTGERHLFSNVIDEVSSIGSIVLSCWQSYMQDTPLLRFPQTSQYFNYFLLDRQHASTFVLAGQITCRTTMTGSRRLSSLTAGEHGRAGPIRVEQHDGTLSPSSHPLLLCQEHGGVQQAPSPVSMFIYYLFNQAGAPSEGENSRPED